MRLTLHFDGSCWPNPGGIAKYGYTLRSEIGNFSDHGFAGEGPSVSNNFAEFFAMAEGLEAALPIARPGDIIDVLGDSEIAIKIMQGKYKANKGKLYYPQWLRCLAAVQALWRYHSDVEFKWVSRKKNTECDELSKLPAAKPVGGNLLAEAEDLMV